MSTKTDRITRDNNTITFYQNEQGSWMANDLKRNKIVAYNINSREQVVDMIDKYFDEIRR